MRKLLIGSIIVVLTMPAFAQHQSFYSQYIYSGLLINSAYAGSQDALNLTAAYRNQWTGFNGTPKNLSFAAHSPLRNKKLNLGLVVSNEQFGISSSTSIDMAFAYRIKLKEGKLSFGLQAGMNLLKNDWTQIKTTDANDPSLVSRLETQNIPKFGAGLYYYNKLFYAGLSLPTLYSFKDKGTYAPAALTAYSGFLIRINEDVAIKPSALVKHLPGSPLQWDVTGTFYLSKIFGLGFGYRSNDAIYAFLDLKINEQFNLGYGYDFTTSKLRNYTGGSHEIMLRYLFKYNVQSKSIRYF